jgi:5-hydroxyisourate hydrolase
MNTLSTHVLDTSFGRPARGIRVDLERGSVLIGSGQTDSDGRIRDWETVQRDISASGVAMLDAGRYRLTFHVAEYFATTARDAFYETISIDFRINEGAEHYHVPLLLNPFGYSTYRGS